MTWNSDIIKNLSWAGTITNRAGKQKVADQIVAKIKDGDVIGVGSGSTVFLTLFAIAERVKAEKLNILAIPTSIEISMACSKLGIPLTSLYEHKPNWCFDGADEVDPAHNLIKGRGGALFKEKLLISSSPLNYIIVDDTKLVEKLGSKFPVPVEVFPSALLHVEEQLNALGTNNIVLRLAGGKDGPVITENGNLLLDVRFDDIDSGLELKLKAITGVIESGLFINYNIEVLVAANE
ncbi:ribose 5-phosphate isomerase A [Mucilaginibacter sp. UR6-11]|uniref:ribose 5-phosphate isomerase A n=1 Tax=Mucilaginibacter sp. UR6-11 TaxID=1435644 RepID=UPI001E523870|nr:ribose 5-phosphate isomerase A [Mucilaginibacter sp. UR6-11]MCC8426773.1 ribose 5-phosphate isomerase A [Mucilaginibacter sp. UR6-11]